MIFSFLEELSESIMVILVLVEKLGEANILETGNGLHPFRSTGWTLFMCHSNRIQKQIPDEYLQ